MSLDDDFTIGGDHARRVWFTLIVVRCVFLGLTAGLLIGWWTMHGYTVSAGYRWLVHPTAELVAVTVLLTALNFADLMFRYRKDPT